METFFTTSKKIRHIIKSFNLTKTLYVSSILIGEAHTGKKTLARYLFPNAYLVSGKDHEEVEKALEEYDELIISDFEKLHYQKISDFSNKRIIATANYMGNPSIIDETFAFIYQMPSLKERTEDTVYLKRKFIKEACDILMINHSAIDISAIPTDLSSNSKSLKKSIYYHMIKYTMSHHDLEEMIYHYIYQHLEGNNGYREYLGLFEKPLIEAGLKKFGSQLKLADILGINRNTLRKKIHEYNIH